MGKKLLITNERITDEWMMNKSIQKTSTHPPIRCQLCALYEDTHMIEVSLEPYGAQSILNNIYIARIQNIVPNLNAAFVEIAKGQICFLPLEDLKYPLFTKKVSPDKLSAADELVVQVTKEAMKTKDAVVTTNLSFPGEYLVLTSANRQIGVSSKLTNEVRKRLLTFAQKLKGNDTHYGIIVRTNAAHADEAALRNEFIQLKTTYETIAAHAASRTLYSCLLSEKPFYIKMLLDTDKTDLTEVITDDPQVFEELRTLPLSSYTIRFYEDHMLPLSSLYNTTGQLMAALKPCIWLKSGANIIIQHTEALTVIDVNSGKNTAKKGKQQNHYKINLEAAKEIAAQMRLRNLSGIIIVDFIDLYDETLTASLLTEFRTYLKQDPVPVRLVDITKLGLVELTRKKQKKPLYEQVEAIYNNF